MSETEQQAWERISSRNNYRCGCCMRLVDTMREQSLTGGAHAAMNSLRDYNGLVCSSIEWMLDPASSDTDMLPGLYSPA
jgi:hypothetical protein